MNKTGKPSPENRPLIFDYDLAAAPETVWRAVSMPEYLTKWLPEAANAEIRSQTPAGDGQSIQYDWREPEPPFLQSTVTFQVRPNGEGGTRFRIVHELDIAHLSPANSDTPMMRAA